MPSVPSDKIKHGRIFLLNHPFLGGPIQPIKSQMFIGKIHEIGMFS